MIQPSRKALEIVLPILVGLGVFGGALVAMRHFDTERRDGILRHEKARLERAAHTLTTALSAELERSQAELESLADWAALDETHGKREFSEFSTRLLTRHDTIRSTTLLLEDRVTVAYPENPSLIGLDVGRDATQGPAVQKMREDRRTVVTGPLDLRQGGRGLVFRTPIYGPAPEFAYLGHVSLVLSTTRLFSVLAGFSRNVESHVVLRDTDHQGLTRDLAFAPQQKRHDDFDVRATVSFGVAQESWTLETSRKAPETAGSLPFLSLALAALAGLGSSLVVALVFRLKKKNEELIESEAKAVVLAAKKANFLATMSHELRTPMNGVIASAELLHRSRLDEKQLAFVETIITSGKMLLAVIGDILDFTKLEAKKLVIKHEPGRLDSALADVERMVRFLAEERGLEFTIVVEPGLPKWLLFDPARLRQVLLNLVGNAIKFTETGGVTVRIRKAARESGPLVVVSVADTGIGITDTTALFREFEQLETGNARRFAGSGLGLSITKKLVELWGGELTVESVVDRGSTFTFTMPLFAADEPSSSKRNAPSGPISLRRPRIERREANLAEAGSLSERIASSDPERIPATETSPNQETKGRALIVDDNYINRFVAENMLKHLGWSAVSVDGGKAALDALAKGKFDVVLMDCQMPDLDGFETTLRIRETEKKRGRHTPIIAMTAGVLEEERNRCFEVGMDDFLEKPIIVEKLVERLEKLEGGPGTAFPIQL